MTLNRELEENFQIHNTSEHCKFSRPRALQIRELEEKCQIHNTSGGRGWGWGWGVACVAVWEGYVAV